jgi:hypothetical protein
MERSPADVLRLVVAVGALLLLTLVGWLFGDTLVGFASDLLRGLDALPDWVVRGVAVATRAIAVVVLVGGLVLTGVRTGWRMVGTVLLAAAVGALLVVALADIPDLPEGEVAAEVGSGFGPLTSRGFPRPEGIAALAGALTAGAPWLSRRWRRWGWVAVGGLVVARFLASPTSFDSFESVLAGWVAGAAVLVALGAPPRRPTADAIRDGLERGGLPLQSLDAASVDARGSTPYFGVGTDGTRYFVKALGDDQRSADLLFRVYRWVQRRELGDERPFSASRRRACGPWPTPSPTPSCWRTRPSRAGRSTGSRPSRSPTRSWPASGRSWPACARSASRIAICASPTSSSATTARSG